MMGGRAGELREWGMGLGGGSRGGGGMSNSAADYIKSETILFKHDAIYRSLAVI